MVGTRPKRAALPTLRKDAASMACALSLEHWRRLGVVGQWEVCERASETQIDLEVGPDRAFPGGIERQCKRLRRRINQAVERVAGIRLACDGRRFLHSSARCFGFPLARRFRS